MPENDRETTQRPRLDCLLTETELARRWRISKKTLQNRRVSGGGIPFLKIGSAVRYRLSDIEGYEALQERTNTSAVRL